MKFQTETDRRQQRWSRLKENKCPLCNGDLTFSEHSELIHCSGKCDFKIRPAKMKQIITSMVDQEIKKNGEKS